MVIEILQTSQNPIILLCFSQLGQHQFNYSESPSEFYNWICRQLDNNPNTQIEFNGVVNSKVQDDCVRAKNRPTIDF